MLLKGVISIKKTILMMLSLVFILTACSQVIETVIKEETEEPIITEEPVIVDTFDHIYKVEEKSLAEQIYVIDIDDLKHADEIMLAISLQGIVAQTEASIFIHTHGPSSRYWFEDLDINYTIVLDVWDLYELFKHHLTYQGYVLYNLFTESMNVATTVAGIEQSVMITERLEDEAIARGLVLRRDVRQRNTRWAIESFKDVINFNAIASQPINNLANRDFIISEKGLIITHIQRDLEGYDHLIPEDTPMLGWGTDEVSDVYHLSQRAITTIASDHAWNISFYAQAERGAFKQIEKITPSFNPNKHYVSFIMTDGDNVQWLLGNDHFFHEERYANKDRGTIPMGWTIAPIMYTLAPSVLQSYYKHATTNDDLVGGPSGIGYINPDVYPTSALITNAKRTNDYYGILDIDYMTIIGSQRHFENNIQVMNEYAVQESILGGFIFANFDRYKGYNGKLWWFNQKPFLSVREAMWDLNHLEPLAARVNNFPISPYTVDGYTLIIVHVWSHDFDDVVRLSQMFESHIEIILPSHMMQFIASNVSKTNQTPA